MGENKFTSMMHAYALGCINTDDLIRLQNYMESRAEYPYQELGEYQNLVALIPSIIEIESPPKTVKENIARNLYLIKDQAKEKKRKIVHPVIASPSDWELSAEANVDVKTAEPVTEDESESTNEPLLENYVEVKEDIQPLDQEITPVTPQPEIQPSQQPGEITPAEPAEEITPAEPEEEITPVDPGEEISPPEEPAEKISPEETPPVKPEEEITPVKPEEEITPVEPDKEITPPREPEEEIAPDEEITPAEPSKIDQPEDKAEKISPVREPVKPKTDKLPAETAAEHKVETSVPDKEQTAEKQAEVKTEDNKPKRSLGDFLAGAEVKQEEVTGNFEFEDYFVEARKSEIKKKQEPRANAPAPRVEREVRKTPERPLVETPKYNYSPERTYRKSPAGKIISVILIILTAAGSWYYFSGETESLKASNEQMIAEKQIMTETLTHNKDLLGILSMKDSRIINLSGTNLAPGSYGKVIYSADQGRGYINITGISDLKENRSYYFWISIGGRNYVAARLIPLQIKDFFPFSMHKVNMNQSMRVFLTEEQLGGAEVPSRSVLLSGGN